MAVVTTRATAMYACPKCKKIGNGRWLRFHMFDYHGESIVGQGFTMLELCYEISISAHPRVWIYGEPVKWSSISGDE